MRWLKLAGLIILGVVIIGLGFVIGAKRRDDLMDWVTSEMDVANAEAMAKRAKAAAGHEQAVQGIEEEYRDEIELLDEETAKKVKRDANGDPAALARGVLRAARDARRARGEGV